MIVNNCKNKWNQLVLPNVPVRHVHKKTQMSTKKYRNYFEKLPAELHLLILNFFNLDENTKLKLCLLELPISFPFDCQTFLDEYKGRNGGKFGLFYD